MEEDSSLHFVSLIMTGAQSCEAKVIHVIPNALTTVI